MTSLIPSGTDDLLCLPTRLHIVNRRTRPDHPGRPLQNRRGHQSNVPPSGIQARYRRTLPHDTAVTVTP
jgi:hypothetical protein